MKHNSTKATTLLILATASLLGGLQAATVITGYDNSTGPEDEAFFYTAKITMSSTDSWSGASAPGAWSFRDLDPSKNQNRGWGHASDWYLIEIQESSYVTLSMTSADGNAQPGFVIYSGESVIDTPGMAHTYSNNGLDILTLNGGWDQNGPGGTTGLLYEGSGFEGSTSSLSGTFFLEAGLYTVAFGNAADSRNAPSAVPYNLSIVTVPEPSAALLGVAGVALAIGRRRRA